MIEILLGARGTGKTSFLQRENAIEIPHIALYATADSLVNDWSKQNVLLASLIPAEGTDLIWTDNVIFELNDKPFKIAAMKTQISKYADESSIYASMESYSSELQWLFDIANVIHYFYLDESQLRVIPRKYFPTDDSASAISKLPKYKYITYFLWRCELRKRISSVLLTLALLLYCFGNAAFVQALSIKGITVIASANIDQISAQFREALLEHKEDIIIKYTGEMTSEEFKQKFLAASTLSWLQTASVICTDNTELSGGDTMFYNLSNSWHYWWNDTEHMLRVNNIKYVDTLEQQRRADRKIRDVVKNTLCITSNTSDDIKVRRIHDWICDNFTYSKDEATIGNSCYQAMFNGVAKCTGYAAVFQKMAIVAGLESHIVTSNDHAWNLVKLDNSWYTIDTTWDDSTSSYQYYLCGYKSHDAYADVGQFVLDYYNIEPADHSYARCSQDEIDLKQGDSKKVTLNGFSDSESFNSPVNEAVTSDGMRIAINKPTFSDIKVKWKATNDCVTVKNGKIKAKRKGKTRIIASVKSGNVTQQFECIVNVK